MIDFLSGATFMASLAVALFFVRFWKDSRDRLFLMFAIAFGTFAVNRLLLTVLETSNEETTYVYVFRLLAFVLIIAAIVDKNLRRT